jgi:hypothetical protein
MQTLVVNLVGKVRQEVLNGRDYIVAPMTMIVPGVLAGNQGALYYPPEEINANVLAWNHVPIVLSHPYENGQAVSARTPKVLNSTCIGVVLNAHVEDGKLKAEGWFDIRALERIEPQVLNSLLSSQPVELSTGLQLDAIQDPGSYNGIAYNAVARNYRPDHLAVLVNEEGACSIADGCGVCVNKLTFDNVRAQLYTALRPLVGKDQELYIEDVFSTSVVYESGGNLYEKKYKRDGDTIVLATEPSVQVTRKVSYVANRTEEPDMAKDKLIASLIANCDCWNEQDRETLEGFSEEKLTTLNEHVQSVVAKNELIANIQKGIDTDEVKIAVNDKGEFSYELKEKAPQPPKEPDTVTNSTEPKDPPKPMTDEEWMKSAPPGVKRVVANAIAIETQQKKALVDKIIANERNVFTEEDLMSKDVPELSGIAALLPEDKQDPVVNYFGAATPARPVTANADDSGEEPLMLPAMSDLD